MTARAVLLALALAGCAYDAFPVAFRCKIADELTLHAEPTEITCASAKPYAEYWAYTQSTGYPVVGDSSCRTTHDVAATVLNGCVAELVSDCGHGLVIRETLTIERDGSAHGPVTFELPGCADTYAREYSLGEP